MSAKLRALLSRLFTRLEAPGAAQSRSVARLDVRVYRAAEDRWYDVKPKRRFPWRLFS